MGENVQLMGREGEKVETAFRRKKEREKKVRW